MKIYTLQKIITLINYHMHIICRYDVVLGINALGVKHVFLKWECVYLIVWLFVNFLKIDKLQSTFHQWESKSGAAEQGHLTKEVLAGCESIEWQVDLLHAYKESMTEWMFFWDYCMSFFILRTFSCHKLHEFRIIRL